MYGKVYLNSGSIVTVAIDRVSEIEELALGRPFEVIRGHTTILSRGICHLPIVDPQGTFWGKMREDRQQNKNTEDLCGWTTLKSLLKGEQNGKQMQ